MQKVLTSEENAPKPSGASAQAPQPHALARFLYSHPNVYTIAATTSGRHGLWQPGSQHDHPIFVGRSRVTTKVLLPNPAKKVGLCQENVSFSSSMFLGRRLRICTGMNIRSRSFPVKILDKRNAWQRVVRRCTPL